jgi:type IV secretory pathway protease TraF
VFVLGDNRPVSMDSRAFGEVNRRQIKGRIILLLGQEGIRVLRGEEKA